MRKRSSCFRYMFYAFLLLVALGGAACLLLFHPNLLACESDLRLVKDAVAQPLGESLNVSLYEEEVNSLRNQNEQLNLELKQAREELQHLELSLSAANTKLSNAQVMLGRTMELMPLEPQGNCAASVREVEPRKTDSYCADLPLLLGKTKDFPECQLACQFNSSCEFYSYWTGGGRNRLCRITSSCNNLVRVEHKSEVVKVYKRMVPAASRVSWLQLLGMYDSGTNLMLATLVSNFPLCCHQARRPDISGMQVGGQSHGRCLDFPKPEKHVNPLDLFNTIQGGKTKFWDPELWDFRERRQIVMVALVRDPLSQLQSWKKAPYGMERCAKRKRCSGSGSASDCALTTAWITEPCQFMDNTNGPPGAGITGGSFRSLPGVWNSYTSGYVRLQEESGYKSVLLVRFEDLVAEPESIIQRISGPLEMNVKDMAVMEGAAKPHGKAKNRSIEMQSLAARAFMKDYSPAELRAACVRLNLTLAEKVGYPVQECTPFKDHAIVEAPMVEAVKPNEDMSQKIAQLRSQRARVAPQPARTIRRDRKVILPVPKAVPKALPKALPKLSK